jgi:hypothetical protein
MARAQQTALLRQQIDVLWMALTIFQRLQYFCCPG